MTKGAVKVEGLRELLAACGRIDKALTRELRKELRVGVGGAFVRDVKENISLQGLVKTGRLRGTIRPAVQGSTLVVRSSPPLRAGPRSPAGYAGVYESRHAFLGGTLDAWQSSGKLEEALTGLLDWVENEWRS